MDARCQICKSQVSSLLIGLKLPEQAKELGKQMLSHLTKYHLGVITTIQGIQALLNGFLVFNTFDVLDEKLDEQKENMRDELCDIILINAPEDIDDDEDEEDNGDGEEGELVGESEVEMLENGLYEAEEPVTVPRAESD